MTGQLPDDASVVDNSLLCNQEPTESNTKNLQWSEASQVNDEQQAMNLMKSSII